MKCDHFKRNSLSIPSLHVHDSKGEIKLSFLIINHTERAECIAEQDFPGIS